MSTQKIPEQRKTGMIIAIKTGIRFLPQNDDASVAELMRNATGGKDDIKNMNLADLGKVLDAMRKAGFKPKEEAKAAGLRAIIKTTWAAMHSDAVVANPDGYQAYCQRICKRPLESLTVKQCQSVLESLKKWWQREMGWSNAEMQRLTALASNPTGGGHE